MHILEVLRKQAWLSREDLAAAASAASGGRVVSRTVYGIEREGRRPRRATAEALAAVLGVPVTLLIHDTPNRNAPTGTGRGVPGASGDAPAALD
jgi:transcriptional regulator with XRE-family HTH domain